MLKNEHGEKEKEVIRKSNENEEESKIEKEQNISSSSIKDNKKEKENEKEKSIYEQVSDKLRKVSFQVYIVFFYSFLYCNF
jgi:hypothetical protein